MDISLTICRRVQLTELREFASASARREGLKLHLKAVTGMRRPGVDSQEAPEFIRELEILAGRVHLEGLHTHFHSADVSPVDLDRSQMDGLPDLVRRLKEAALRADLCHCANSAATLRWPDAHLDMVRVGGAMYGLNPDSNACRLPSGFTPALQRHAQVIQTRHQLAGEDFGQSQPDRSARP